MFTNWHNWTKVSTLTLRWLHRCDLGDPPRPVTGSLDPSQAALSTDFNNLYDLQIYIWFTYDLHMIHIWIYIWFTYDLLFNFHFLEGFLVSCLFLFFISWFILLIYTIDMLNYADMLCPIAQLLLLLSHCRWTLWRSLGSPAEVSPTCGSRRNISLLQVGLLPTIPGAYEV